VDLRNMRPVVRTGCMSGRSRCCLVVSAPLGRDPPLQRGDPRPRTPPARQVPVQASLDAFLSFYYHEKSSICLHRILQRRVPRQTIRG